MKNKATQSLGILSYLLPSVPIFLVVVYFLISAIAAAVSEGWIVFYGAIFLLVGLTFLTPLCGCIGLICSILTLYRRGVSAGRILAVVLNCLLLVLSVPLILSFLSNT